MEGKNNNSKEKIISIEKWKHFFLVSGLHTCHEKLKTIWNPNKNRRSFKKNLYVVMWFYSLVFVSVCYPSFACSRNRQKPANNKRELKSKKKPVDLPKLDTLLDDAFWHIMRTMYANFLWENRVSVNERRILWMLYRMENSSSENKTKKLREKWTTPSARMGECDTTATRIKRETKSEVNAEKSHSCMKCLCLSCEVMLFLFAVNKFVTGSMVSANSIPCRSTDRPTD